MLLSVPEVFYPDYWSIDPVIYENHLIG